MRTHAVLVAVIALATSLRCQPPNTGVPDVGLTMQRGSATGPVANSIVGQRCGPFTCQPFSQPSLSSSLSTTRTVRVYGAPNSIYVLLLSTGPTLTPCVSIPGFGNSLILGLPAVALTFGVTGPQLPSTSAACNQGVGTYQLVLPVIATSVIPFRMQALTESFTAQGPAFTVAVQGYAY